MQKESCPNAGGSCTALRHRMLAHTRRRHAPSAQSLRRPRAHPAPTPTPRVALGMSLRAAGAPACRRATAGRP
eukprot:363929-Chlamydomonas_euryale.AAC.1